MLLQKVFYIQPVPAYCSSEDIWAALTLFYLINPKDIKDIFRWENECQTALCHRNLKLNVWFHFLLSIPVENFEDHSAPPSPDEKDSGFFMLRKDSERRATLHRIMTEDQDKVVANLTEALTQVGDGEKTSGKKGWMESAATSCRLDSSPSSPGLWGNKAEAAAHLHPRGQSGWLRPHGWQENHRQHAVSTQAGAGLWQHRHQSAASRAVRLPGRCKW